MEPKNSTPSDSEWKAYCFYLYKNALRYRLHGRHCTLLYLCMPSGCLHSRQI